MLDFHLYLSLLSLGFLGSTHCVGMCGGLQHLLMNVAPNGKSYSLYVYNLGRMTSYLLLTLFAYFLFSRFTTQTELLLPWSKGLRLLSGVIILLIGVLNLFSIKLPYLSEGSRSSYVFYYIRRLANPLLPPKNYISVYVLGCIWGLLPCGLLYSALVISVTANTIYSSLFAMFCFSLATMPFMIGLSSVLSQLKKQTSYRYFFSFALILIGLFVIITLLL